MRHVVIYKSDQGWVFRFGVRRLVYKRLIDALLAAEALKINVDNRSQLIA